MSACRFIARERCSAFAVRALILAIASVATLPAARATEKPATPGALRLTSDPAVRLRLSGPVGERVGANVHGWLLPCPAANPGLLEMFALRDRQPAPQLVPWAGEFVGKYLISAIQALRMVDDAALQQQVADVVRQVCDAQAKDGYLGPFPREQRLLAHWDLWGHYHVLQALLMWHERTGDERSLTTCRRAADLMTRIYLDGNRRVLDAGSHEMNMAVIHALGILYRQTGEPRYRLLMDRIVEDWTASGDYLRTGEAGVEFFRTPRPRWESLHDLQGLVELYRLTGEERYRRAFLHHWSSIRQWDRRNNGAFSSGEQATGNPFEPTPIETCCTIAWMAISLDALALSGDPRVADELELSTYNAVCGAQHPSGRWWTYSTPMDGTREASAHAIVFQSRYGTPELNCCSVNGPRGLGMLSEWAVMRSGDGLAINYYGPGETRLRLADGREVVLEQETDYPKSGRVTLTLRELTGGNSRPLAIALRIPEWSKSTSVRINGQLLSDVRAGSYCTIERAWQPGDTIELELDMALRAVAGDLDAAGRVSLYRGPLLLAFDQADNPFDEDAIPTVDMQSLTAVVASDSAKHNGVGRPWLLLNMAVGSEPDAKTLTLRDYASAGAGGTRYRSWLPAQNQAPPAPVAWLPADGARVPSGRMIVRWRRPVTAERAERKHRLVIARDAKCAEPLVTYGEATGEQMVVPAESLASLQPGVTYYWKLVAVGLHGETESTWPYKSFQIDPQLPPISDVALTPFGERGDGTVIEAPLAGNIDPTYGRLAEARGWQAAEGPDNRPAGAVEVDGRQGLLRYALTRFPTEDYTLAVRARIDESAFLAPRAGHVQQVASAWCGSADDPLRLCLDKGKLFARSESPSGGGSTQAVAVEPNRWHHLAVVKGGARVRLFVDGMPRAEMLVPTAPITSATDIALGGNPHHTGDEYLPARFADFHFYARALETDEVRALSAGK